MAASSNPMPSMAEALTLSTPSKRRLLSTKYISSADFFGLICEFIYSDLWFQLTADIYLVSDICWSYHMLLMTTCLLYFVLAMVNEKITQ